VRQGPEPTAVAVANALETGGWRNVQRNLSDALYELAMGSYNWTWHTVSAPRARNSMQAQGESLEEIVKDILCGVTPRRQADRAQLHARHLAHEGSRNYPPDAMYRGGNDGDAFEIKKVLKYSKTSLELNSSPPYSHLVSTMTRIPESARLCEPWTRRDLFYAIGDVAPGRLVGNWLWFVEGRLIGEDWSFYDKIESDLRPTISQTLIDNGLLPAETNELGRVNKIDKLKRTSLRIRGMWSVANPTRLFQNLNGIQESSTAHCTIHAIISERKWNMLLGRKSVLERAFWEQNTNTMSISACEVDDTGDLDKRIDCVLIRICLL
jgi:hypothetical protein